MACTVQVSDSCRLTENIENGPKLGLGGILGVKTVIFIFLDPKRHIMGPKHAF
jgi:hypothetical protein